MQSEHLNRITIDDAQCGGRPCIRGMRIRVTDILELLAARASFEEILEDCPYLEREDVLAAIQYAAHQMDHRDRLVWPRIVERLQSGDRFVEIR